MSLSLEARQELKYLKKRRGSCKTAITRLARVLDHYRDLDLVDLNQDDLDELKGKVRDAIASYEDVQSCLDELELDPAYKAEDLTDTAQSTVNNRLLKGMIKLESAYKAQHKLRKLQARLPTLECVVGYAAPAIAAELKECQDNFAELEAKACDIRDSSFVYPWEQVSTRFKVVCEKALEEQVKVSAAVGPIIKTTTTTTTSTSQVRKIKNVSLPSWSGNLLEWRSFLRSFEQAMPNSATEEERHYYLLDCLKDSAAAKLVRTSLNRGDQYSTVKVLLNSQYDQPRESFLLALCSLVKIPTSSRKIEDIDRMMTTLATADYTLQTYGDGTVEQLLTSLMEMAMDQVLHHEWIKAQKDTNSIPSTSDLVDFLQEQRKILCTSSLHTSLH